MRRVSSGRDYRHTNTLEGVSAALAKVRRAAGVFYEDCVRETTTGCGWFMGTGSENGA